VNRHCNESKLTFCRNRGRRHVEVSKSLITKKEGKSPRMLWEVDHLCIQFSADIYSSGLFRESNLCKQQTLSC
jgi:hypothetical protein